MEVLSKIYIMYDVKIQTLESSKEKQKSNRYKIKLENDISPILIVMSKIKIFRHAQKP